MKISPRQSKTSLVTTILLLVGLAAGFLFHKHADREEGRQTTNLPTLEWQAQLLEDETLGQ